MAHSDWDQVNIALFDDHWSAFGRKDMTAQHAPTQKIRVIEQKVDQQAIFDGRGSAGRLVLRYLTVEAPDLDNGHVLQLDDGRRCRVEELSRDGVETVLTAKVVA